MGMNLKIDTTQSLDDAKSIETIVNEMDEDIKVLDRAITDTIADGPGDPGILTTWSTTVKGNWNQYVAKDVPTAFDNMKLSATNLKLAVEEALNYSTER